jgi:hypothetical protein
VVGVRRFQLIDLMSASRSGKNKLCFCCKWQAYPKCVQHIHDFYNALAFTHSARITIFPFFLQKDYSMGPNFISALILTGMNKYDEEVAPFLALSRETWGEEILWDALKDKQYGAEKRTRLMYAAKIGDLARVKWLLKRGANVKIEDARGKTALFYANEGNNFDVVRELILAGGAGAWPLNDHDDIIYLKWIYMHNMYKKIYF